MALLTTSYRQYSRRKKLNSGSGVLLTAPLTADETYIPPTITANNPVFTSQVVYTSTDLSFQITPPYNVYQNSKIVLTFPYYKSDTSFFQTNTSPNPTCTAVSGIQSGSRLFDTGLSCSAADLSTSHKVTIIGGFANAVAPSTLVSFKVSNVYTPLSVGAVVDSI